MSKFARRHEHCVGYLLIVRVSGFARCKDLRYIVNWFLGGEFMSLLPSLDDEDSTNYLLVAKMYNNIGSPTPGAAKIGLLARRALISSNPVVAASVHLKLSVRRSSLYNGNAFSPNLEIKSA